MASPRLRWKSKWLFVLAALVLGGNFLQAADDSGLEQQYAAMLDSLRAQISQSVPNLDARQVAAFQKAYTTEGIAQSAYETSLKGKAHIGSPDTQSKAEDARYVQAVAEAYAEAQTNLLSEAKPVLQDLKNLLTSDALDAKLVKCAVLANATPRGLAEFARQSGEQQALVAKLLADDELMKQMLLADGAKAGHYGQAMEIYSEIQQASKRAGAGILQRLALGTSLEQAAPGRGKFDPVKRYLSYEKAYLGGELDPAFKNMTTWECRMITDAPESDKDLAWCREMLRNYRPDHIFNPDYRWRYSRIVRTDVPYKTPDAPTNDGTSRIQQLLAGGGKCGPRAFVGRFALRAFGIPTWGVTQPGHAALAHWTPNGWTINLGADWKFSWWEDRPGSGVRPGADFYLESQARAYPEDFVTVLRAQWIGDALGEPKVNPNRPGSGGLWHALALSQEQLIVAEAKPTPVSLAGADFAEATEPTKTEAIVAAKTAASDRTIATDSAGVIIIPAAACSRPKKNTKNIEFMKSFTGGMQMAYHHDETFEYSFDVSRAGQYALTARVVTVHKQQWLDVAANDNPKPTTISLPYTLGQWQETKPVLISLKQGKNKIRFNGPKDNMGMTIKQFTLKPVN